MAAVRQGADRPTVLLINPRWQGLGRQLQPQFKRRWPPLGLAVAAALLERRGIGACILDNNVHAWPPARIGRLARGFRQVFVTSSPFDRWQCPALDIGYFFDTLRDLPRERLYLMGAHVTERPAAILVAARARAAILGEPEATLAEVALKDDPILPGPPDTIAGLAFWDRGVLRRTAPREPVADLDAWPPPAWHLLPMRAYAYEFLGDRFTVLEGSRGCPYHCRFCYRGMHGRRYRCKRVDRLVDEVLAVRRGHGVRNIYFMDLEFGLRPGFVDRFCRALLRNGAPVRWCCQMRADTVDSGELGLMRRAGCRLIHLGVEAGSARQLARMGKGISTDDCRRAVQAIHRAGMRTALFFNFGFPGETESEMAATLALALELNPTYAAFHLVVPFPGTALAEEVGVDVDRLPVERYPQAVVPGHAVADLQRRLRRAYLRFYLRPGYLAGLVRRGGLPGPDQLRLFVRMATG